MQLFSKGCNYMKKVLLLSSVIIILGLTGCSNKYFNDWGLRLDSRPAETKNNIKAKSSIIEQLSRKKKEIAEREVSRTDQAKSKKQDMEL